MKLASTKYYDGLPTEGNQHRQASAIPNWKKSCWRSGQPRSGCAVRRQVLAHDIRVMRLPRHRASCRWDGGVPPPDRNIKAKMNVTVSGLKNWKTTQENTPRIARKAGEGEAVKVDLNRPISEILKQLFSVSGFHASIAERHHYCPP
ncbi:hypothetical protein ACNKHO_10240 [Shigella flexneri]